MKGTIITGEEVLKRISKGEWDAVKNIYAIYSAGKNGYYAYCQSILGCHYK